MTIKKVKKKIAKLEIIQEKLDVSHIPGLKAIEIETRKFVQFDFDFTNSEVNMPEIKPEDVQDAIVKVNIRVKSADAHKINYGQLEEHIRNYAHYIKPISPIIQKERRVRIATLTADLNPINAVKAWLESKEVKNSDMILKFAEEVIRSET